MRIGLISDIHANLHALRAVLRALDGADVIVCAGDLTGYYTRPNEVIAELLDRGVHFIAGNHDVYIRRPPDHPNRLLAESIALTRSRLWPRFEKLLSRTACQQRLVLGGLRFAVFHGSPWDPQEQYIYPDFSNWQRFEEIDADVILLGHTHRPVHKQIGRRLIVNPGSCGQPRDGDWRAAYALLDSQSRQLQLCRIEYDSAEVVNEARGAGVDERILAPLLPTVTPERPTYLEPLYEPSGCHRSLLQLCALPAWLREQHPAAAGRAGPRAGPG